MKGDVYLILIPVQICIWNNEKASFDGFVLLGTEAEGREEGRE